MVITEAAHDTRKTAGAGEGQRDHQVHRARSQQRYNNYRCHDVRNGIENINAAHDDGIGNSALEACLGTQDGSDEKAQHYGTNTDDQE